MRNKTLVSPLIYFSKIRYEAFFNKAKIECKTAHPMYDVLHLLLNYYLENTFIIHRKMKMIDDLPEKERRKRRLWTLGLKESDKRRIALRITKEENKRFTRKVKKDGVTKTHIMNMLVDFYMKNEFVIETRVIRVNKTTKSDI